MKRFKVGQFMKKAKDLKDKKITRAEKIRELDEELSEVEERLEKKREEVEAKNKEMKTKEEQLRRLDKKVDNMVEEIEKLSQIEKDCNEPLSKKRRFLSEKSVQLRQKNPTRLSIDSEHENNLEGSISTINRRRRETLDSAMEIHGATETSTLPAQVGLIDTALHRCNKDVLFQALSQSKTVGKQVLPKIYKNDTKKYEDSDDNMIRSVAVYYNGGVMGKKKYRKIYRDTAYKTSSVKGRQTVRISISNLPVPRLVPYNKLMPFIKSIPIGTLYSVYDNLCSDMPEDEKVSGFYRDLKETLLTLGQFYLSGHGKHDLVWFDEPYTFYFSLGGDGAPFGKDDCSCAWLIGLLNIGRGILSSNENFLIFGANCIEACLPVRRYINVLLNDIRDIENNVFVLNHNGSPVNVKFRVGELPNDMKMLAFLSGELSNSAKFFSSFADVNTDNADTLDGTFGKEKKNTWKPWSYTERLKVVKGVETLKKKLEKEKLAPSTRRSKITTFIASKKSRQEFVPLIGEFVNRIHVDPLHLKNNACALIHRYLLDEVIQLSEITPSVASFSQVKSNSPLARYISAMKTQCGLSRLSKQIVRWFNTCRGREKTFQYRFTGKDSRGLLHNFMYLIAAVEPFVDQDSKSELMLHSIAYYCLVLRDCVSLFSRIDISDEQVNKLEQLCNQYHRINIIYFQDHPTAWTLAHIVPAHTKEMKVKYDMGLGLNSMEGREAKHVFISKYSINTIYHSRWEQIFRHEFISLVWLRERRHNISKPATSASLSYIPKRTIENSKYCYCGFPKASTSSKCKFCLHPLRAKILNKLRTGKK